MDVDEQLEDAFEAAFADDEVVGGEEPHTRAEDAGTQDAPGGPEFP